MRLSEEQLQSFRDQGLLLLPNLFSDAELEVLRNALREVFTQTAEANVREKASGLVRTAMGLHLRHETFARLVRHPRLVEPARQIAGSDELYIQQVKVNVKGAFDGEAWQWHYDFATHHHDDGVPEPLALNLHVFLDEVSEFNGPLYFIRGSHRRGAAPAHHDTESTSYPLWVVERETVSDWAAEGGLIAAKGPPGTGLIFGDLLVHCSPPNLSPWDRAIFSLILNPVANRQTRFARPDYKHHRDFTPVEPLADDCLLQPLAVSA